MKNLFLTLIILIGTAVSAQTAEEYFVSSASLYVQNDNQSALDKVSLGLKDYPDNKKLQELKKIIEQESENDQKQSGDQSQGQNPEKESQDQGEDNDSQQQSGQQNGRNQGQEGTGSSDKTPLNEEGKEETESQGNQGERLQKERYENILKSLEEQEQETQRRLILGDSKTKLGRKQKDW